MVIRILLALSLVAGIAGAADSIDTFFDRFTAEWVRADPNLATITQYFSGADQEKLDAQLTPVGATFRRQRVDMARRALAELRRFDRTRFTPVQRTSARVLEWQLEAIIRGAAFDSQRSIFDQVFGQPRRLVRFLTDHHPARNVRDAANYLSRLGQVAAQLDEMKADATERAGRGFTPPRFILTLMIGDRAASESRSGGKRAGGALRGTAGEGWHRRSGARQGAILRRRVGSRPD